MKKIARFFLWYGLLTKRLFKRPGYLAVLLLVPLLALALMLAARQDSGVVTVAIVCEDEADPVSAAAAERLLSGKSILRFLTLEKEADARSAVLHGEANAAWIFHADASETFARYAEKGRGTVVTVVEREDNVYLRLAREKLYAALYPELSFAVFARSLETLGVSEGIERETLRDYYDSGAVGETSVVFAHVDGGELQNPESYLVSPLRGLLSLLVVLCGFASGLYCYREEREETFVRLSRGRRRMLPFLCHLTAILPAGAAALLALAVAGVLTEPLYELFLMLCFALASAAFCELVRCLCRTEAQLGALIPVLLTAMLALCPVFFDFKTGLPLPYLFPPFYYLRGAYSVRAVWELLLYTALTAALAMAASEVRRKGCYEDLLRLRDHGDAGDAA